MKTIETSLGEYKRSLESGEHEIKQQESKICEQTTSTWNLRRQNDQSIKYKGGYEAEQGKIADSCTMYDNFLSDNQKLRLEHQNLQTEFSKSNAEFKEA